MDKNKHKYPDENLTVQFINSSLEYEPGLTVIARPKLFHLATEVMREFQDVSFHRQLRIFLFCAFQVLNFESSEPYPRFETSLVKSLFRGQFDV